MRYFIQTTIPVDEQEPSQGIAVNACDDLDAFGDFVTVKVSARQFERVVSALRAGAVPHLIGTYAPGTVEQTDGTFRETTKKNRPLKHLRSSMVPSLRKTFTSQKRTLRRSWA